MVGAMICLRMRVLTDVYGSDLPYAEDGEFAVWVPPHSSFEVVDGMCRADRRYWLPWQRHGADWCFGDDDPNDMKNGKLRREMHEKRRK